MELSSNLSAVVISLDSYNSFRIWQIADFGYYFKMTAQRGQISTRCSQRRRLFLTWRLNLRKFLLLFAVGTGSFIWVRGDRTSSKKLENPLAATNTEKPYPALTDPELSTVESWECIRAMHSAFIVLTVSLCICLWTLFLLPFP